MRKFKIPGKVQAKQRPRLNLKNGRVYTPQPTINYESYVKWCYSDYAKQEGWDKPLENAISAEIEVLCLSLSQIAKRRKKRN